MPGCCVYVCGQFCSALADGSQDYGWWLSKTHDPKNPDELSNSDIHFSRWIKYFDWADISVVSAGWAGICIKWEQDRKDLLPVRSDGFLYPVPGHQSKIGKSDDKSSW